MAGLSLLRQGSEFSQAAVQRDLLERDGRGRQSFAATLRDAGWPALIASSIEVLQINLGKLCNQTCRHCHVDAGPDRREIMTGETVDLCLEVLARTAIPTVDITGGAPEMNPHFRRLVESARRLGRHVIDRCNLTILLAPGFDDLAEFLARCQVEIVASLPCYLEENTDRQRGAGVFAKSVEAIRRLNSLGYGQPDSRLVLTLVYNPIGPSLPPDQTTLEAAYRKELGARYGLVFNRLFTITNMPISRFLEDLVQSDRYDDYMQKLIDAFNPVAVPGVMCRTTLSVDWEGRLYDCDFNQMLEIPVEQSVPRHIRDFDLALLANRRVVTGRHCFGCTAGSGSSCQGKIV